LVEEVAATAQWWYSPMAAIRLAPEELRSCRFVVEAEAAELLPPIRARRLCAMLAVRAAAGGR